jgi:uncharacterized protein
MNCPICNITLNLSERQGVEIDYCPQCRGLWLDRGELDKIIERSLPSGPPKADNQGQNIQAASDRTHYPQQPKEDHHYDNHHGQHGKKRHKSWLGDIFD